MAFSWAQWKDRRQRGSRRVHTAIASAQQLHALQICLRDFVDEIQAQAARSPSFDALPFIERSPLRSPLACVRPWRAGAAGSSRRPLA